MLASALAAPVAFCSIAKAHMVPTLAFGLSSTVRLTANIASSNARARVRSFT
jgi:hypothetical protein